MTDQIQEAVDALSKARSKRGYSLRAVRRAGVELFREALVTAAPMLHAEARQMPVWFALGDSKRSQNETGRGIRLIDLTDLEYTQRSGNEIWLRVRSGEYEILIAEVREGQDWGSWDYFLGEPRTIGLREAVRRFGANELVTALCTWLIKAAEAHNEANEKELAEADRFRASLTALKGQKDATQKN